jgi:UPF0716 protein FxsA
MKFLIPVFIILPALEIGVLIWSGHLIGAWNTVTIIILTGILGVYLAKRQGLEVMYRVQDTLQNGNPPGDILLDGLCVLLGGVFLIFPGYLTDIIGLFLLLPPTRNWVKALLKKWFKSWSSKGTTFIIRR